MALKRIVKSKLNPLMKRVSRVESVFLMKKVWDILRDNVDRSKNRFYQVRK
jgi:hypothetical protein